MLKKPLNILILLLSFISVTFAQVTKLPRFVTVKSNQVNARTGPGTTHPVEWVFVSKGEPVKIITEFEQWRKVEDVEGKGGWVHSSVLSPKRSVVMTANNIQKIYANADDTSRVVAKLEPQIRCALDQCKKHRCKIKCNGYKGWINASFIWGVLPSEEEDL